MARDYSHRLGKKTVRVVAKDGSPIVGQTIRADMQRHEFLFGAGMFDAVPYASGEMTDPAEREAFEKMFEKWSALMNNATLPFYWGGFEPEEGKPHTDMLMAAAQFLRSKDVTVKGHPLCWHTGCVPWLMDYDNETILRKQLERIHREVSRFKGVIDMWDVINEVVIMPIYNKYDNAITRICKEHGRVALVKKVFDAAQESNPDGVFLINDFNLSTNYEILIDGCLNAGVPIKAIGLQSHQHQGVWTKAKMEEILGRYEHFGLPIHFTENTIVAGPLVPPEIDDLQDVHYEDDAATPEYEQKQADALEAMYRTLFEKHPLMTAITNWDFGDGAWLNAPSGVIRRDNSLKPAYNALHRLIKEEWHTSFEAVTDAEGYVTVNGFKGSYELTANGKKGCFKLSDGSDAVVTVE